MLIAAVKGGLLMSGSRFLRRYQKLDEMVGLVLAKGSQICLALLPAFRRHRDIETVCWPKRHQKIGYQHRYQHRKAQAPPPLLAEVVQIVGEDSKSARVKYMTWMEVESHKSAPWPTAV